MKRIYVEGLGVIIENEENTELIKRFENQEETKPNDTVKKKSKQHIRTNVKRVGKRGSSK